MNSRGSWGSKVGFILAASGSAVGLGNIWRFPYTAGKNGGALFVLIYLIAVVIIAFPVLLAEVSLGRHTGKNPVGAFKAIAPKGMWKLIGYLGVITGIMILSYYAVVAGWTVGYLFKSITGKFQNITNQIAESNFSEFISSSFLQVILLAVFLFLTVYIVSKGIASGIEKFSKILMPLLLAILFLLLIRSLTLEGAMKGLEFYLKPDFSKLSPKVILDAMGQAFFSLSLGMGTMITYGSYVSKSEDLPSSSAWIAFFDTFIAIIAGFIIFPAIFSQGMNPAGGPGLVFNILPVIFSKIPGGIMFGSLFFALLSIAALTSTISLLEVPVAFLIDEKRWSRKKSVIVVGLITFIFGVPSALSTGGVKFFSKLPIVGKSFFDLWDFLWGNLSLSIGAFFIAIFVGYVWKASKALIEISHGTEKFRFASFWMISIKFISPVIILLIFLSFIL